VHAAGVSNDAPSALAAGAGGTPRGVDVIAELAGQSRNK
jgi:hypothetical protein